MVEREFYGRLRGRQPVHSYTITNRKKEFVRLLDYGASIEEIAVLDKDGRIGPVTVTLKTDGIETNPYLGATIGRCANRIAFGRYRAGGQIVQLERNKDGHFFHGGSGNYAKKLFDSEILAEMNGVRFHLHDTGEGGFPCTAEASVTYSFDDEGRLSILYEMEGADCTVLSPTNHAFFNLSGNGDVREQYLWIASERTASRDAAKIPDGGTAGVKNTTADFSALQRIRDVMDKGGEGGSGRTVYDEYYLLKGAGFRQAAALFCAETGRMMKVFSDMPCLILFLYPCREEAVGKHGEVYAGYCSVCLETGFVPNAVNFPAYGSPLFPKGRKLVSKTVYQFERCLL
ncbi:MAG: galactose mutarotase [Muribaculaceae bacterium]|nr:galactose mutarotase [Muribaculaceae bacterium]